MLIPLNWLKDYVDLSIPPEELGEMLTMAGLELESVDYRGKGLEKLVVARITEIKQHPNADRLKLCTVTDGNRDYEIVCGATNMKEGDNVALATAGASLPPSLKFPEGLKIRKTKIRGQSSEGMLCAENELGLTDESEGIMILPESAEVGSRVIDVLNIEDIVFELGITPNRPDCLSLLGVAREVSAITGMHLMYPSVNIEESGNEIEDIVSVNVSDPAGCPRYSCRVIENIEIGPSPGWLKSRIESSGIRSINNLVDITNFVLLEYGQPLHAFDLDKIEGKRITVRNAMQDEEIETIDGIRRKLTREELLICDNSGPVALAGIMGGANSEVSEKTSSVLLESAYFDAVRIRRSSKRVGLRTESSYRFERGVDPHGVISALERASSLIAQICGGNVCSGRIDVRNSEFTRNEIKVDPSKVNKILGTDISSFEISDILESIEFKISGMDDDSITVTPPSFRIDVTREIDIVEEIGRLFGYNNIQQNEPFVKMVSEPPMIDRLVENRIKDIFISHGYHEAINYSFEDPSKLSFFENSSFVNILNPLTTESSSMRTNLIVGLLRNLKLNLDRGESNIALFESGRVYIKKTNRQLPREIAKFAALATGRRQPEVWGKEEYDFFDLKNVLNRGIGALSLGPWLTFEPGGTGDFLHPGNSSKVMINGSICGSIGELHPDFMEIFDIEKKVCLLEIDMDRISKLHMKVAKKFVPLPKFPGVRRDISLVVDEQVNVSEIIREIKDVSRLIEDVWVFDLFRGKTLKEGKKSVAVSMLLRGEDRTLTDSEANKVQDKALNKLVTSVGAELRPN